MPRSAVPSSRPVRVDPRPRVIITIDGPAGTGKSSTSRVLAKRLGVDFLDTGAMYRAAAALVIDAGVSPTDHTAVCDLVAHADVHFDWTTDPPAIFANGRDLSARVRDADVTALVSPLSAIAPLRGKMVTLQRQIAAAHPRLVTEGRDQGSAVFPDADVKFYLDSEPAVRAQRRAGELRAKGQRVDEQALLADIIARDHRDSTRADGPLLVPPGAVRIDTSRLTFEQVVDRLEQAVRAAVPSLGAGSGPGHKPTTGAGG